MVFHLQNNIVQLAQIAESLKKEGSFDSTRITKKIVTILTELENAFQVRDKQLDTLKDQTLEVLTDLEIGLKAKKLSDQSIQEISRKILQIETAMVNETTQAGGGKLPVADVKFALISDIDVPDRSAAMLERVGHLIEQGNVPFITTRSVLRGVNVETLDRDMKVLSLENRILENDKKWRIFEPLDHSSSEYVIFLPAGYHSDWDDAELLKAHDLLADGTLQRTFPDKILNGPQGQQTLDGLTRLFTKAPSHGKLFFIAGHGGESVIGGLKQENFRHFLEFLKNQKCKGLMISSCFSGGKSSVSLLPPLPDPGKANRFETPAEGPAFPTIVRSIGDFSTTFHSKLEMDLNRYFEELSALLNESDEMTLPRFRKLMEKAEKGLTEKFPEDLMKVYFPHSPVSPGGFRPVGEGGKSFSLTYSKVKQEELSGKHPRYKKAASLPLRVKDKEFLNVHPLVTNVPVHFEGKNPVLLSMVPGQGHHYLESIILEKDAPLEFIEKVRNFHKDKLLSEHKGFFIESLTGGGHQLDQVALHLLPDGTAQLIYSEGDNYYYHDETGRREITAFQYVLALNQMAKETTPTPDSIRAASGGQESEEIFKEAIQRKGFWPMQVIAPADFKRFFLEIGTNPAEILALFKNLSENEKVSLIFFLIGSGHSSMALQLIQTGLIPVNKTDLTGKPLLLAAVQGGDKALVRYLLEHGESVNQCDKEGSSPLHVAVRREDRPMTELLLGQPGIEVDIADAAGWTPIATAASLSDPIFKALVGRDANVDSPSKQGFTPLSISLISGETDAVSRLLKAAADPNAGQPSALNVAIYTRNPKYVRMMLEAGGKAFAKDLSGRVPFIEAIKRGTPEIVQMILHSESGDLNVEDHAGLNPLVAALLIGRKDLVQNLLQAGARFPQKYTDRSFAIIGQAISRILSTGDLELLKQLLVADTAKSKIFSWFAALSLLEKAPESLAALLEEGLIDFNCTKGAFGKTLFQEFCQQSIKGNPAVYHLIDLGIRKGVDVNAPLPSGLSLIDLASMYEAPELSRMLLKAGAKVTTTGCMGRLFRFKDMEIAQLAVKNGEAVERKKILRFAAEDLDPSSDGKIFKWLVEQGGDVNEVDVDGFSPFSLVVRSGNFPLVAYCLENGAVINPKGEDMYLPMEIACLLEKDPEGKIFKKLVESGGDLNTGGKFGYATAFAILVRKNQPDLIRWAIKNGAEVNPSNPEKKIAPVQAACFLSKQDDPGRETLKLLVEAGASINTPGNSYAPSPFVELISQGDLETVNWCLGKGANVNLVDTKGDTPLQAAAKLPVGDAEPIFHLLVEAGADINDPGENGIPPVAFLLSKGNVELLEYFFQKEGVIGENLLENAFDSAVSSGNIQIVEKLLERGLSISPAKVNELKLIPIGYQTGGLEMLQRVLAMGGSFDSLTETEKMVLIEIAAENGEEKQVKALMTKNLAPLHKNQMKSKTSRM